MQKMQQNEKFLVTKFPEKKNTVYKRKTPATCTNLKSVGLKVSGSSWRSFTATSLAFLTSSVSNCNACNKEVSNMTTKWF